MRGAREYARLFKTGQYGKLFITVDSHARGKTFEIQIIPRNEKAIIKYNRCQNENAVTVYGALRGNPGWDETYGWLHEGKWQEDFELLYQKRIKEQEHEKEKKERINKERMEDQRHKIKEILLQY